MSMDDEKKMSNFKSILVKEDVRIYVEQNSPTSAKQGDGLGYITICVTLPRRLVF